MPKKEKRKNDNRKKMIYYRTKSMPKINCKLLINIENNA